MLVNSLPFGFCIPWGPSRASAALSAMAAVSAGPFPVAQGFNVPLWTGRHSKPRSAAHSLDGRRQPTCTSSPRRLEVSQGSVGRVPRAFKDPVAAFATATTQEMGLGWRPQGEDVGPSVKRPLKM